MIRRRRHGLSLLEILGVVALLAALAAIALPVFSEARQSANETAAVQTLRALHIAQSIYRDRALAGNGQQSYGDLGDLYAAGLIDLPIEKRFVDRPPEELPSPAEARREQRAERRALNQKHREARRLRRAAINDLRSRHRQAQQARRRSLDTLRAGQRDERRARLTALQPLRGAERAAAVRAFQALRKAQDAAYAAGLAEHRQQRGAETGALNALRKEHREANAAERAERRDLRERQREATLALRGKLVEAARSEDSEDQVARISGRARGYVFELRPAESSPEYQWFGLARPAVIGASGDDSFVIDSSGQIYRVDEEIDLDAIAELGRLPQGLRPLSGR